MSLWVSDNTGDEVFQFVDPTDLTTFVRRDFPNSPTGRLFSPLGLSFDRHGALWVADINEVFQFADPTDLTTFVKRDFPSNLPYSRSMSFDRHGALWVADDSGDQVFQFANPTDLTTFVRRDFPSDLTSPLGMSFDRHGALWVADDDGDEVFQFADPTDLTTFVRRNFPSGLTTPGSMSFDRHGALWVADNTGDEVFQFADPTDLTTFVRRNFPSGLTIPSGMSFDDRFSDIADRVTDHVVLVGNNRLYFVTDIETGANTPGPSITRRNYTGSFRVGSRVFLATKINRNVTIYELTDILAGTTVHKGTLTLSSTYNSGAGAVAGFSTGTQGYLMATGHRFDEASETLTNDNFLYRIDNLDLDTFTFEKIGTTYGSKAQNRSVNSAFYINGQAYFTTRGHLYKINSLSSGGYTEVGTSFGLGDHKGATVIDGRVFTVRDSSWIEITDLSIPTVVLLGSGVITVNIKSIFTANFVLGLFELEAGAITAGAVSISSPVLRVEPPLQVQVGAITAGALTVRSPEVVVRQLPLQVQVGAVTAGAVSISSPAVSPPLQVEVGAVPTGAVTISSPAVIAITSLWVADTAGDEVFQFFDPTNLKRFVRRSFPSTLTAPFGMAFDRVGALWVADSSGDEVFTFADPTNLTSSGSVRRNLPSSLTSPEAMAFDKDGALWITDTTGDEVFTFADPTDLTSFVRRSFTFELSAPLGLAFDEAGAMWVADNSGDESFQFADPTDLTTFVRRDFPSVLVSPYGQAFDRHGALWVVDTSGDEVFTFADPTDLTSFVRRDLPSTLTSPEAMAFNNRPPPVAPREVQVGAVDTGAPTVRSPVVTILPVPVSVLQAGTITSGAPTISSPVVTLAPPLQVQVGVIDAGIVSVRSPRLTIRPIPVSALQAGTITTGAPTIRSPAVTLAAPRQVQVGFVTSGAVSISSPAVNEYIGSLWVADTSDSELFQFFDPTDLTVFIRRNFPSSLGSPLGLGFDQNGAMWVVDNSGTEVFQFADPTDLTSFVVRDLPSTLTGPRSLSFDRNDGLWISDDSGDEVFQFADPTDLTTFVRRDFPSDLTQPFAMSFNRRNELWVADNAGDELFQFADPADLTTFVKRNFPSSLGGPRSMSFDRDDSLWVGDNSGDELFHFADPTDLATFVRRNFPSSLTSPLGLSFDDYFNIQFNIKVRPLTAGTLAVSSPALTVVMPRQVQVGAVTSGAPTVRSPAVTLATPLQVQVGAVDAGAASISSPAVTIRPIPVSALQVGTIATGAVSISSPAVTLAPPQQVQVGSVDTGAPTVRSPAVTLATPLQVQVGAVDAGAVSISSPAATLATPRQVQVGAVTSGAVSISSPALTVVLVSLPAGRYYAFTIDQSVSDDQLQTSVHSVTGADGEDGQGLEFIFARTATIVRPAFPDNAWGYDSPEDNWTDGAPSINVNFPYLWRVRRRVEGAPQVGDAVTADWTTPVVVGRFGSDGSAGSDGTAGTAGSAGSDGTDGLDGINGANGEDGNGYEWIFARTASVNRPSLPSNSWGFDQPSGVWTDAAPGTSASLPYLWQAQRRVDGLPPVGTTVSARWTSPKIVSRYGTDGNDGLNGIDGANGEDGNGYEWIFARTSSAVRPSLPSNNWGFDQPSGVWTDAAASLTQSFPYLWRVSRRVEGIPNTGTSVSDNWTSPTIVFRYGVDGNDGLDGVAGADGNDGNGVEYVFARTASASSPSSSPSNSWRYDTPSGSWTDAAPSLSSSLPYLWRSQRSITGSNTVSGLWTSPRIVGRYGDDGHDGLDGVNGLNGNDGRGYEWIFAANNTGSTPRLPSNSWGYDSPSGDWNDAAPNLSASNQYLFQSQRKTVGTPRRGAAVSDSWTTPKVVGHYGIGGLIYIQKLHSGSSSLIGTGNGTSFNINTGLVSGRYISSFDAFMFACSGNNSLDTWGMCILPRAGISSSFKRFGCVIGPETVDNQIRASTTRHFVVRRENAASNEMAIRGIWGLRGIA